MNGSQQIQQLAPEQVYQALSSRPEGLSSGDIEERLREVGRNSIELADPRRWLRNLARQFSNFFTLLLIASAVICLVADRLQPGQSMTVLGGALLGVALLNAAFSFFQEYRAEKAMEALQNFLPQKVQVMRDGKEQTLLAEELVPGDVLLVAEGDRVPADARLIEANGLQVNNAPLTGESKPLTLLTAGCDLPLAESDNVLFAGCSVLKGQGRALVFATGIRTEFGKLAHLSQSIHREHSPLERETAHMVRVLTVIAATMGGLFFLYGVFSGRSLWVNLVFMMGIIVANVPEGLLPTFTLSLAMASLRMAQKNVLVKGLNAVEALGAVHVICTDKTGTLTRNRLTITTLVDNEGQLLPEAGQARLLQLALWASEVRTVGKQWTGDPLDVAVAERYHAVKEEPSAASGRSVFFPFDPDKRRSAGIAADADGRLLTVKGAWESLQPLLAAVPPQADSVVERLALDGLRVIAVASRRLAVDEATDLQQEDYEQGLELVGFLGIEDPVRPEVPPAVVRCHEAGIEVVMITGDHPGTALVVAMRCGILPQGSREEQIITGDRLAQLSEPAVAEALQQGTRVFARTSPEQKMKIVAAIKSLDKVVAMTGDGVNDAPALKAADVGVAMGQSGTDVARASAQIILLDDNFASIVAGVEEGRTVFANIRKFTNYVLVSNGPEILPYLLYILLPVPLALTVIQILTIDLGTDIIPSMGLGQEPPDPDEMRRPPRDRQVSLLTPKLVIHSYLFLGLLEAAWSLLLFFLVLLQGGWHYGRELAENAPLYRSATGIALATILLMQIGNLVGRRFPRHSGLDAGLWRNKLLLAGILIQIVFSWGLLYWPPLQRILGTGPVPWSVYLLAGLGIPLIFGLDYLRKRLRQQSPANT
jgi:sodium/potassium-transporting ATPase subunit alpha